MLPTTSISKVKIYPQNVKQNCFLITVFGSARKQATLSSSNHLKGLLFGFSYWYTSVVGFSFFKSLKLILSLMQDPFIFKPKTFLKQNLTSN